MLLRSLDPRVGESREGGGDGNDLADAVRIDGAALSRSALVAAGTAVSKRVGGAQCVAVLATPTAQTVSALVGCVLSGIPVVPVPADVGVSERAHILADSGARTWLGDRPEDTGGLPHIRLTTGADGGVRGDAAENPPGGLPDDGPALIIYTSGTTGPPKGVLLSRGALAADLDALAAAWQWNPDDVLVHGLPLYHVHGLVLGLLGSLRMGNRMVHTGRPAPEAYARARVEHGGSLYFGVPTVWSRVVADPAAAAALRPARLLVSGSAPLPVPVFDRLAESTGHRPIERYGCTETLITVSTRIDGERRPGWVGLPLDGVQTRLIAEDGSPAPRDGETIGGLQVRGPTLFDGYLNRPEATAEAFDDGWYRTGDVAVIDADGMHRIVGRESVDLIKTGGFRVGAGEIETVLLGHPDVAEVAVVGLPDDDLGQRIVAFVVGAGANPAALIDHVAGQLSVHKRPREVRVVEALPRNAMGKVLKKELMG